MTARGFGSEQVVLTGRSSWIMRVLSSQKVMNDYALSPFQRDVQCVCLLFSLLITNIPGTDAVRALALLA